MAGKIHVLKASGKKEAFSEKKVRRSIRRAGVPPEIEEQLVAHIRGILYEGIPTGKIYQEILRLLKESSYPQGRGKYSLKQAIMDLGPSGYPFEKFMAEVFVSRGYRAEVGVVIEGKCAKHEVDVVARKNDRRFLVECKFHNYPGVKTDVKVGLYVKARFDDIEVLWKEDSSGLKEFDEVWLVTNTKFTRRAIKYCECAGVKLLGWNYPAGDSLRVWVGSSGLYPLTCLFSLSQDQKRRLLEAGVVLCRDFVKADFSLLRDLGFSSAQVKRAVEEAGLVYRI